MTMPRQNQKPASLSLVLKAIVGAGFLAQLSLMSTGATAAAKAGVERPVTAEYVRAAYRPNCSVASGLDSENGNVRDRDEDDRAAAPRKAFCRLAAEVALSIRNNPGIF